MAEPAPVPAAAEHVAAVEVIDGGNAVAVTFGDGQHARFHAEWLRDNAQDETARDPHSGQRLGSLLDVPCDTRVAGARTARDGALDVTFTPGDRTTRFAADWLRTHVYDRPLRRERGWCAPHVECWDAGFAGPLARASLDALRSDRRALAVWLAAIRRLGFALVDGVPREPGAVCGVVDLFGFVRETQYGRCFDVRAEVDPVNLAYTNLGLAVHTDNPYRDPVPTLQLLACLENDVDGGETTLVDGFRAARILRDELPEGFEALATHCARFEYAGMPGVRLSARRPVIELTPDGELIAVRVNNRSTAPPVDVPFDRMPTWYAGLRRFTRILARPELGIRFRLSPGEAFIVDNTRVLHGRTAWTGAGSRRLQGCYADRDGLLSTLAALEHDGA